MTDGANHILSGVKHEVGMGVNLGLKLLFPSLVKSHEKSLAHRSIATVGQKPQFVKRLSKINLARRSNSRQSAWSSRSVPSTEPQWLVSLEPRNTPTGDSAECGVVVNLRGQQLILPLELGEALKEANGVLVSADMNSMSPWCQ